MNVNEQQISLSVKEFFALQANLKAFEDENETLKKKLESYQASFERLEHQFKELLRYRFGSQSERDADLDPSQLHLFKETQAIDSAPQEEEEGRLVKARTRKKKKNKNTDQYARQVVVIEVPENERQCDCGCEKKLVRYEIKELYNYIPAVFEMIEQRREIVACPKGCEGSMKTAPAPKQALPKVKATESFLSHIIVSKLHHRQPLYHLEKYVNCFDISRTTMARWMVQLAPVLQPVLNLMRDQVIEYDISSIDATTFQVLKEPGRTPQKKSYAYCIRGGPPDQSVILYAYNHKAHKQFVDDYLEGFKGSVHMDADNFFDQLLEDPKVSASYCNGHARRKFESIKKHAKKQGLAHEAMRYYKRLYKIERQAKDEKLNPAERKALRDKESKPILDELHAWLIEHEPLTLPESPICKAIQYCTKRWEGLMHFLTDGRLEFDNNLTEQEIKPFVIARKNFMFADSMEGAHALCTHMSFVRTALLHKLNPYEYYVELLKRIPYCESVEDYEKLLPWNISNE